MITKYAPHICVYAYWLIGLPGTSKESIEENIQAIKKLISQEIVHIISPKIFIPYPGTIFYEKSSDFNLYIVSKNFDNYERISPPYPYYLKDIMGIQLEDILQRLLDLCIGEYMKKWNLKCDDIGLEEYNTWYGHE